MHIISRLSMAAIALTSCAFCQSFVDSSPEELRNKAPELSGLAFDANQSSLNLSLLEAQQQLESMIATFINVSIAEDVHEMRFDKAPLVWTDHREQFRYIVRTNPFTELRAGVNGSQPNTTKGFVVTGSFQDMLGELLPENPSHPRFRYLGRMMENRRPSIVLAFLESDGSKEGLVWLDEQTKRILRIRRDILKHSETDTFESFTREVRFVPVTFSPSHQTLWLPASVTVHVRFPAGELHSVHRYSDYRAEGPANDPGQIAQSTPLEDDGFEVLLQGVAELGENKPQDALAALRVAAQRLPERVEPAYCLGLALFEPHELAAAELQFRETIKRAPNFAPAHHALGTVLDELGNKSGAVAEFQETLRLDPENAKARASLDRATGATPAASVTPIPGGGTIKVNVRQVLVPTIVTDKEGHHVTGLTQADFTVLEDGVEQKITAFSSERMDVASQARAGTEAPQAGSATAGAPKSAATRHGYVICLDMLHASFGNFVYLRQALEKLFREEQAGDSQYAVIALGRTMEIIQNATQDPAKVLEALGSDHFRLLFKPNPGKSDVAEFERDLQDIRAACDARDPRCRQKQALPAEARQVAEHERQNMANFLAQLRSVVEQMARGNGRRTLVLISDGFSLAPGESAYSLLNAYFPEFRSNPTDQLMQDSIEPIFRLAVKANVTIDTIDSRGLYTPPSLDASRTVNRSAAIDVDRALNAIALSEGQTLSEIAAETGGRSFQNSNDLFTGLKKAFADGREYYMLA